MATTTYDVNKTAKLDALKVMAERIADECATNDKVKELEDKIKKVEAASGEDNVIEGIKVNGVKKEPDSSKTVEITVPTKVGDLENDEEYQTATDVAAAVAAAEHLKRKIVASVSAIETSASDAGQYIYLVPKTDAEDNDNYDEYMVINGKAEKVGDWGVDLSDYAKTDALGDYVRKEGNKKLSDENYTAAEKAKLADIEYATNEEVQAMLDEVFDSKD